MNAGAKSSHFYLEVVALAVNGWFTHRDLVYIYCERLPHVVGVNDIPTLPP